MVPKAKGAKAKVSSGAASQGRRLKVYWAEIDGLNDWVVAAPNQGEALKAFGVHQDLFQQDEAGETNDPDAIEAARAAPLQPLRRAKGLAGPWTTAAGPSDWSAALAAAKPVAPAPSRAKGVAPPTPGPEPDRRPLDRARARLDEVEGRHRDAMDRLAADRARLDERQAREEADYGEAAAKARRELAAAERAWREAGGH